ncbi:putative pectinesterase/pectinesterase inhibitor 22 [Neltuma alba]|uniref:putative pectinesterase/pectinesterase inhibitor 22 n=1 Tax=Neltuma alba TaxID=207710 RepID=UPI0010A2C89A|nr:putative pectinesterase/pectinesterase inhibitor 22 [Prosopis alba]
MANCSITVQCFVLVTLLLQLLSSSSLASSTVTVSIDGHGDYTTIAQAISEAPSHSGTKHTILVRPGIYKELLHIPRDKTNILLIGDGRHNTVISDTKMAAPSIHGAGFVGQSIAFVNSAGPKAGPGIALLNAADRSVLYNCSIEGFQDTLWASLGRQFYRECHIYGSVDFVMGNAAAVFQNCMLYARLASFSVFTAQSRDDPLQRTGFVFHYCRFTVSPGDDAGKQLSGAGNAILGRPWRAYSRVVIMRSYIDDIVSPMGWGEMKGTPTDKVTYVEFENEGPRSNTRGRVRWIGVVEVHDKDQVKDFTVSRFIKGDDWIPPTGVPYMGGL